MLLLMRWIILAVLTLLSFSTAVPNHAYDAVKAGFLPPTHDVEVHNHSARAISLLQDLKNVVYCTKANFDGDCWALDSANQVCKEFTKDIRSFRAGSEQKCILDTTGQCNSKYEQDQLVIRRGIQIADLEAAKPGTFPYNSYRCVEDK